MTMTVKTKSLEQQICRAIQARRLLSFDYGGHSRVVVPYCYGISNKDDNESLRAIQVAGKSTSRGFGFGKLWTVTEMTGLRVSKKTFVPDDPNYNPDDSAMKHIICRIERDW